MATEEGRLAEDAEEDLGLDEFDPLADEGFDVDEDTDFPVADGENLRSGHRGEGEAAEGGEREEGTQDERPAEERIAELFSRMERRRRTLLGILDYCADAKPVNDVLAHIEELKLHDRSVYSPNDLCGLLQQAGAIERVGQDGEPYVEGGLEPRRVTVDGATYLEPQTPPPAFWRTTDAGMAALREDDPLGRTRAVLEQEAEYLPIYRRVLTLCAREGGASAREISRHVDGDPLLKSPRLYSSHFVERLNEGEALSWGDKVWLVTDAGREALDELADVDDEASDRIAAGDAAGEE